MKKNKVVFLALAILSMLIIILSGCNNNTKNEDMKSKIAKELDYLDTQIISILNDLNNLSLQNYTVTTEEITLGKDNEGGKSSSGNASKSGGESGGTSQDSKQSDSQEQSGNNTQENKIETIKMEPKNVLSTDENEIDWNSIKSYIETINETWGVIILDLSNMNVDNNDILKFSSTLDNCILSIKDEKKPETLINISNLYSFIPKFEKGISAENSIQNIKQVKSYIINAYALIEKEDWTEVENNISEAEKAFKNIANDIEYMKDKEYKVNKTYVLIKELQNSLANKDKKLFYIKYKNLMESINTL